MSATTTALRVNAIDCSIDCATSVVEQKDQPSLLV